MKKFRNLLFVIVKEKLSVSFPRRLELVYFHHLPHILIQQPLRLVFVGVNDEDDGKMLPMSSTSSTMAFIVNSPLMEVIKICIAKWGKKVDLIEALMLIHQQFSRMSVECFKDLDFEWQNSVNKCERGEKALNERLN